MQQKVFILLVAGLTLLARPAAARCNCLIEKGDNLHDVSWCATRHACGCCSKHHAARLTASAVIRSLSCTSPSSPERSVGDVFT